MIEIVPEYAKDKDEYLAALEIKKKLIDQYPDLETSKDRKVKMIIEPSVERGSVFSVDIVIIGIFEAKKNLKLTSGSQFPLSANLKIEADKDDHEKYPSKRVGIKEVEIVNFITCVEVKKTDQAKVFKGENNHIFHKAYKTTKDVTDQNLKQVYSLKEHIAYFGREVRVPLITRFMYFPNLDRNNNLNDPHLIHSDSSGKDILRTVAQDLLDMNQNLERMVRSANGYEFEQLSENELENKSIFISSFSRKEANKFYDAEFFATPEPPTTLDMKRMNTIAKESISQEWIENVGKSLTIFQGLGGTGKTIRLLQIAYKKFYDEGANSLLLTYNWALISNLRRLMAVMGIPHYDEEKGGIRIGSLEQFMYKLLGVYGMYSSRDEIIQMGGWKKAYPKMSEEFAKLVQSGGTDSSDRHEAMNLLELDMDYCFIDEGQDWTSSEQVIIKEIFKEQNIVVAHGKAQDTRGIELHWDKNLDKDKVKKIHTRKALRMKPNLSSFVKTFARKILKNDEFSNLTKDEKTLGGQIYLVIGDYFKDQELHSYITDSNPDDVEVIDNLFCIYDKDIVEAYKEQIGEVWEGFRVDARRTPPSKLNQARFINYKSCRGLEGWTTFNFNFDDFWSAQVKEGFNEYQKAKDKDLLYNEKSYANDYAAKWALIAFTRSIDSTVIHLSSDDSEIAHELISIQKGMPETIELIRVD